MSTGQLYTWRKQTPAKAMTGFVPVEVVPEVPQLPPPGMIEITLPSAASMRIAGCADAATLRVMLVGMGGR